MTKNTTNHAVLGTTVVSEVVKERSRRETHRNDLQGQAKTVSLVLNLESTIVSQLAESTAAS